MEDIFSRCLLGEGNREELIMILKVFFPFLVLVLFSGESMAGAESHEPQNLIQREMMALDRALAVTIDAIVINDLGRIPPAFDEVHRMREQVEYAVKSHSIITLPRNQKRFKEFVRLDNKFHHELEILLQGAKNKKMRVVQRQTHRLLDACVRCHSIFRKQG